MAGKTTATFSGTPSAAGSFTFGVSVKGCGGHVATANYTVVIQSAANHVVALSWNSGSSSNLAGYNLYRAASAGGPFALVNASLIPSTLYADSSVANNTQYFYQVTAVTPRTKRVCRPHRDPSRGSVLAATDGRVPPQPAPSLP